MTGERAETRRIRLELVLRMEMVTSDDRIPAQEFARRTEGELRSMFRTLPNRVSIEGGRFTGYAGVEAIAAEEISR